MLPEATYTLMLSSNIQTKLAATVPTKRLVLIVGAYGHRNCLLLPAEEEDARGGGVAVAAAVATTFQTAAAYIITERTFSVVLHTTTRCAEAHILCREENNCSQVH